jgi:hypothetical protein
MKYALSFCFLLFAGPCLAGQINVMQEARFAGNYGLKISVDSSPSFLEDGSPEGMSRYRVRFYVWPDALDMPAGAGVVVFRAYDAESNVLLEISLVNDDGTYKWTMGVRDSLSWQTLPNAEMLAHSPGYHSLELDYQTGAGNGYLRLTLDNNVQRALEGISNNGFTVEYVRLGMLASQETPSTGTLYFDDFVSTSGDAIEPITCGTIWQYEWGYSHFGNGADVRDLIHVYNDPCFALRPGSRTAGSP